VHSATAIAHTKAVADRQIVSGKERICMESQETESESEREREREKRPRALCCNCKLHGGEAI